MTDFLSSLNIVDYIIIGFSLIAGLYGLIKGLVGTVATRISYFAGFFMTLLFTTVLAQSIAKKYSLSLLLSTFLAYIIVFMITYSTCFFLSHALSSIVTLPGPKVADKILGLVFCVLEILLLLGLLDILLRRQSVIDLGKLTNKSYFNINVIRPMMANIEKFAKGIK